MAPARAAKTQAPAWVLEIKFKPLDELRANPRNAKVHPEPQIEKIKESLRRFGWYAPVGHADGVMSFGHARLEAARRLRDAGEHIRGTPSPDLVPTVDLRHLSPEDRRALALADNRLGELGQWDTATLAEELAELARSDFGLEGLGFSRDDLAQLADAGDMTAAVQEVPVSPVEDRFWISVRGPLAQQAQALQALRGVMAEIPGVMVEIGTVTDG